MKFDKKIRAIIEEDIEERAAILEYVDGMPRKEAEKLARIQVEEYFENYLKSKANNET